MAETGEFKHHNPNPKGRNQYKNCPPKHDPKVEAALWDYHHRNISDKERISKLLLAEHGIKMSSATVTRRRRDLGIKGSGATTRELSETEKRQLILNQLEKHPTRGMGPRRIQEAIAADAGVHLTRDFIAEEMHRLDPEGFTIRHPTSKKKYRTPLICLGPNYEISCDGHDKLSSIGFPIYGARDVWSGKWHGLWVLPNNRLKIAIAYVYLSLVKKLNGMPLQVTTDRGSETGGVYAFANALREEFAADYPVAELPPHRFLPSIHNTTIERGWLRLRLEWGDDVKVFWEAGQAVYDEMDPDQYQLVQWLWPKLIQQELDKLCTSLNNHKPRRVAGKLIPTGVAPNISYAMPESYGGQLGGLQCVDIQLINELMEDLGGEDLIRFVSHEYEARAEELFASLGVGQLSFHNVWDVFTLMLSTMKQ